ncbi:unnamed protein product [Meloidogyne enterolobii]|uniref:Uncharacterized protein n=1 Tax=Meloidogyne enterolobii TaxID=390850 RepID=A0ACB0Y5P5_MELEN
MPAGYMTDVQCDLADFQKLSRQNNGYNYALVAIDVLSKRVFAEPVRTKKGKDMIQAFEMTRVQSLQARKWLNSSKRKTLKSLHRIHQQSKLLLPNDASVI